MILVVFPSIFARYHGIRSPWHLGHGWTAVLGERRRQRDHREFHGARNGHGSRTGDENHGGVVSSSKESSSTGATRPRPSHDQQHGERPTAIVDADEAWTQFATTNALSMTTSKQSSTRTPNNAIRIYSDDSVVKKLLPQLNEQDEEYKLKLIVAEHVKALYEPKRQQMEEAHRESNLANENEIRCLNNLLMQQTNEKTATEDKTKKLPPEVTYDAS